jgi:xylulokinase
MAMYLGLDLGTSGLRALLVDDAGAPLAVAEQAYGVAHPHPGWSEQDPADWIAAAQAAIAALIGERPAEMAALRGIGFSGQMHGAVLLDRDGAVLRPAILWNDTRAADQAARMDAAPGVRDISGNIVFPGFTAPKLIWLAERAPELFARVATVLLPKDYLVFWLTGRLVTDMSDAAGTSWLDVGARAWSDELLGVSGMRADQMPDLIEGNAVAGTVLPDRAQALGLPPAVEVVPGGADNAAAACGVGALADGQGFVSLGTSGVILAARDRFAPDPATAVHTFCHAVPGRWYQMAVMLAATDSLNWLARAMGADAATLTGELGEVPDGPGRLRFLPYLSGERTPHNDAAIRGGFLNLDIADGRAELTRAVLEGVAFGLRDGLDALSATGARLDTPLVIGGGARSPYWVALLATVLDTPLALPERGEFGAALGAARLALSGVTGAAPDALMTKPPVARVVAPDPALVAAYAEAHAAFRAAYSAIRNLP